MAVEAVRGGKGSWVQRMLSCLEKFGWQDLGAESLRGVSEAESKGMLESIAWRRVKEEWRDELEKKPKLVMLKKIMELEEDLISSCAGWKVKSERKMLLKLRGGTAAFQVELGRWHGVRREDRMCKECNSGEVEDVVHWLVRCPAWSRLRESLRSHCTIRHGQNEEEEAANILCQACVNHNITRGVRAMYEARFGPL